MKKNKIISKRIIIIVMIIVLVIAGIVIKIEEQYFSNILQNYPKSNFHNILEILYFISSLVLMLVGIAGLAQIKIAQKAIQTTSKREAYTLAAEQCKYYLDSIIPILDQIDQELKRRGKENFGKVEIINSKEFRLKAIEIELAKDMVHDITNALNALEAVSVFFVSGVADEKVGFSAIGSTYVNSVNVFLPIIVAVNKTSYQNVTLLYSKWRQRIEKQNALIKKLEAEEQLKEECAVDIKSIGV